MNGNNPLVFDISDDSQFRQYCVQQFTLLGERTAGLPELKAEHEVVKQEIADLRADAKSDKMWTNIKMIAGPFLVAVHAGLRALGIHI